jgi:hypothetical protein
MPAANGGHYRAFAVGPGWPTAAVKDVIAEHVSKGRF